MRKSTGLFSAAKNKIKSDSGVSILFALLLFLVCLVVSATVIAAAMASAGRASQIAEIDQRYFSVRSAADLFRDQFDGGYSLSFERQKKETTTNVYSVIVDTSNPEEDRRIRTLMPGYPQKAYSYSSLLNGQIPGRNRSIMEDIALDLLYGYNQTAGDFTNEEAYQRDLTDGITGDITRSYKIDASASSGGELNIDVKATVKPSGNIEIVFSSPASADGKIFRMKMVLTAHISETVKTEKTPETSTVIGDYDYGYTDTVVSSKTDTKTTTVKWECTDFVVIGEEG